MRTETDDGSHAMLPEPPATPTQPAPTDVAGGGAGLLGHVSNGGGYTLSDDQMESLRMYAHICCSRGDFTILRDWVELQIDKARLDAAYEAARKATDQAFDACRKAVQP